MTKNRATSGTLPLEQKTSRVSHRVRAGLLVVGAMTIPTIVAVGPADLVRATPDGSSAAVCRDISPLACDDVRVELPFSLDWAGDQGGIVDSNGIGTGFTMVDAPSSRLEVDGDPFDAGLPGYEPSKLTVDTSSGELQIVSTNGTQLQTPETNEGANSQLNALGVGVDASEGLEIRTVLRGLDTYLLSGNHAQQAGIWFGLDEDNYAKLVVVKPDEAEATETAARVQLLVEVDGGRFGDPEQAPLLIDGPLFTNAAETPAEIELILLVDPSGVVSAEYSSTVPRRRN
jgi:hypothetical protein